jgi:hypothetical protein
VYCNHKRHQKVITILDPSACNSIVLKYLKWKKLSEFKGEIINLPSAILTPASAALQHPPTHTQIWKLCTLFIGGTKPKHIIQGQLF